MAPRFKGLGFRSGFRFAVAFVAVAAVGCAPDGAQPQADGPSAAAAGPRRFEGRTADEWLAWIGEPEAADASWAERSLAAARAFPSLGNDAVTALVAALGSPKPWVREYAAYRLGDLGDRAVPAMPDLLATLEDRESYLVVEAGSAALGNLAMASDAALAWLVETADRGPPSTRVAVIAELGHLGGRAAAAIPSLRRIAAGPDVAVATAATEALEEIEAAVGTSPQSNFNISPPPGGSFTRTAAPSMVSGFQPVARSKIDGLPASPRSSSTTSCGA